MRRSACRQHYLFRTRPLWLLSNIWNTRTRSKSSFYTWGAKRRATSNPHNQVELWHASLIAPYWKSWSKFAESSRYFAKGLTPEQRAEMMRDKMVIVLFKSRVQYQIFLTYNIYIYIIDIIIYSKLYIIN